MKVDVETRRTFWDTRERLGGYLLEVVIASRLAASEQRIVDGQALRGDSARSPSTE